MNLRGAKAIPDNSLKEWMTSLNPSQYLYDTNINKKFIFKEGKILQSLYKSAVDLKIEPNVIVEFARLYGFQVDFQRDIRKGDKFQVMYERYFDDRNKQIKTGKILYAYLNDIKGIFERQLHKEQLRRTK